MWQTEVWALFVPFYLSLPVVAVTTDVFCVEFFFFLFNDNLATGGSLTGAILSCHVEL